MMTARHTTLFAAAALAVASFGCGAQAQDATTPLDVANGTMFGDWIVSCEAVTISRNVCRLLQEQTLRDNNGLVARFIALPAEEGGAILLAQVPMGVYLPGGAVYRLENAQEAAQQEMIWQRCWGNVCEAALGLEAAQLEAIDDAGAILFGYRGDISSEPVITRVDMSNFRAGLDALRAAE